MDYHQIHERIERAYAGLSPQLKRAAKHAIDHPDDVALLSMRQLAARADVHPSTMVRLAKVLDVGSYPILQKAFQARLRTGRGHRYTQNARTLQADASRPGASLLDDMMSMEHSNIESIMEGNGREMLHSCARQIAAAGHVYIGGVRSCYSAAHYFYYALNMFSDRATLLDGWDGAFADGLRGIGPGDVLLAISLEPYSNNIIRATDYAARQGAQIVAITDSAVSPLLNHDRATGVVLRADSPSLFHSMVPVMSVVQSLVLLLIADGGEEVLAKLSESEDQLDAFGAYWHDEKTRKNNPQRKIP